MYPAPASGAKAVWPMAAIFCLGFLGFLVAATIVLALIPVYLPTKQSSSTSATTDSSPFYTEYLGTSSSLTTDNDFPGSVLNTDQVGTQLGVSSLGKIQSGSVQPVITRRRRGVVNQRDKRGLATSILFKCATIFAATCTSTACRTTAINSFKAQLSQPFSNILLTVNISSTQNTTNSYTLVFLSFYNESTKPVSTYTPATSTNFTASQTGLFSTASTWSGGIVPYGNCTVIIPANINVTIVGSSLDIRVITFYVNGTLGVGQGSSTFKFTYATSIIILGSGRLQDLTTGKNITLAQESYLVATSNASLPSGSNIVVGGSSRSVGDTVTITNPIGPYTAGVYSTSLYTFQKVTHMCRRSGLFLLSSTYLGAFPPSLGVCSIAGCDAFVGPGASLLTSDLNGVMNIPVNTVNVSVGGSFSMGTPSVQNFTFLFATTMQLYGQLVFAGSGGAIRTPIGSSVSFFRGSSFSSSVSVSIQAYNSQNNTDIGKPFMLSTESFSGSFNITVSPDGIIQTNGTGNVTTTTTATSVTATMSFLVN